MEDCHRGSLLSRLASLLLFFQLPAGGSAEEFVVIGPSDPIVAVMGGNVTLPCHVSPAMDVENMELRWFRSKFSEAVFIYENQQEQKEEQLAQYTGRTSLVKDFLSQGEATVRIHKVQASDNGLYTCFFRKGNFYEEASLELKVAGVGSVPQVHITGPEEDGVRVVCTASGWFPKPQIQWRAANGEKFLTFSETHAQDTEGLFSVESALVVRDSSSGNMTCSVLNPVLDQKKAMAIFIPEPFFPQASPWKPAFIVSLVVLMLSLLGAAYYIKTEHTVKRQEMQEWERLHRDKEEARRTKEEALKARDELQEDLGRRKSIYLGGWRKAQLYADWRKEKFQALSFTLDPASAHLHLAVSGGQTSVTLEDTTEDPGVPCSILGQEAITSGRCYWEVEIRNGNRSEWGLGVCRGDVERKGWYREGPELGFWVLGWYGGKFCALLSECQEICDEVPHRVGVFLDLKEGDVSFYNMTDGSHLFSFSLTSSTGTLFPYFTIKSGDVSLTICSVVGVPTETPVPLNNPSSSLEEPVSLSGDEFSSGCAVDGALPEAGSPLLPYGPEAM
ncbi:butyrophilin-like protein 1 [Panthera tigris]|uniref:butyrophilin-like protein 1 n=1 Tax=Panthera tigris TaxID=9694 RepID=UPI001C6F8CF6|nr:butyrophilin-like protein 1 [Panthera tigris]XP_042841981.1 butyrophilin-like protein 1 [Panthera tigris]XP_042841982.1 butyrophilin-like protein 1 [Panthera tigris]